MCPGHITKMQTLWKVMTVFLPINLSVLKKWSPMIITCILIQHIAFKVAMIYFSSKQHQNSRHLKKTQRNISMNIKIKAINIWLTHRKTKINIEWTNEDNLWIWKLNSVNGNIEENSHWNEDGIEKLDTSIRKFRGMPFK